MLRKITFPQFMKNPLRILAFAVCVLAGIAFAGDFKSAIIAGGGSLSLPHVANDQFLVIRNFTQDGAVGSRGFVMVTTHTGTANVLTAAILDPSNTSSLEVINDVVIAGPADVTVTCGDGTDCFITYRKGSE
jgi:hypothetical protein